MRSPLILLLLALTASAQAPFPAPAVPAFQAGDVIVGSAEPACVIDPPPPPSDQIAVHGRDASLLRNVSTELISALRYAAGATYAAHQRGTGNSLDVLDASGGFTTVIALPPGQRITALGAAANDILAVAYNGAQPELWQIHLDMVAVTQLPQFSNYVMSIDVAGDRCTMFYTTGASVERFDRCRNQPLSTFARVAASAVRVLPDGGVLVASGRDLLRYDAAGNVVARFTLTSETESIGAISLDTNPSLVWIVTTYNCNTGPSRVMQVSVDTGAVTAGPQRASRSGGFTIAVHGEWRAAVDRVVPPRRRAVR
jgi:hypothetical protein